MEVFDLVLCDVRSVGAGARLLDRMRHAHLHTPAMLTEQPLTTEHVREAVADVLRDMSWADDEGEEREEPILEVIATFDNGLDAFAIKSLLRAHGIQAILGSHALAPATSRTDVYVMAHDAEAARALLAHSDGEEFAKASR